MQNPMKSYREDEELTEEDKIELEAISEYLFEKYSYDMIHMALSSRSNPVYIASAVAIGYALKVYEIQQEALADNSNK